MKNIASKATLAATLLTVPFVAANAKTAHEAWIEAQKIDIEPTLRVNETVVPLDQIPPEQRPSPSSPSYGTTTVPGATTPTYPAPAVPANPGTTAAPGTPTAPANPGMPGATGQTGSGSYVPAPTPTMPQDGSYAPQAPATPYGGTGLGR